ncbi:MAG: hypothetical protein Ct9H300mP9_3790 [Candidatus Neomarinimicrobiota bacterium]|nr:MAG: hypothetical protein Ct9H300mP9_3790 [Candidatus Neomarinimicrobiota bacterium]
MILNKKKREQAQETGIWPVRFQEGKNPLFDFFFRQRMG